MKKYFICTRLKATITEDTCKNNKEKSLRPAQAQSFDGLNLICKNCEDYNKPHKTYTEKQFLNGKHRDDFFKIISYPETIQNNSTNGLLPILQGITTNS